MWNGLLVSILAVAIAAVAEAWPNLYDNEFKRWSMSRRDYGCKETGGKCYSTGDCCKRYVCAAIDEEGNGLNPTTPGWCVHEKELEPCMNSLDCDVGYKCVSLGSSRYCVKSRVPEAMALADGGKYGAMKSKGGLGSNCQDDSDCDVYDANGSRKLCCQNVRRGRQGVKKMCDRISPISICITKKK